MENDGGSGSKNSHWERFVFGDEMMTATDVVDARTTKMTLAVAKDSGWYDVDLETAEVGFWAKGDGCGALDKTCPTETVTEFCSAINEFKCSDNHVYMTLCQRNSYHNNCPILMSNHNCKVPRSNVNTRHRNEIEGAHNYGFNSICLNQSVKKFIFGNFRQLEVLKFQVVATPLNVLRIKNLIKLQHPMGLLKLKKIVHKLEKLFLILRKI